MNQSQAMADAKHTPGAVKTRQCPAMTDWKVTLADGRIYTVQTYPESACMYVENARGRNVNLGDKMRDEIRAAIAKATGANE